jgi:acetylglutamate kinase
VKDVNVLREALPYIRKFKGRTFVVKFGGEVADDADRLVSFCEELALCVQVGIRIVVVHGGGKQATELSARLGIDAELVNGRRVTDERTLDVVKMVFAGKLNTEILGALRRAGVRAVGLSGVDGDLLRARRRPPQTVVDAETGERRTVDFGFVGDILDVDPQVLVTLASDGFVPVIASLAADDDGTVYNVNADTVAAAIATSLGAEKWIIATNVAGVLDAEGRLVSHLTADGARELINRRVVKGGMIPKLEAALAALAAGVGAVHLIDGTRTGALLGELFTVGGNGTMLETGAPASVFAQVPPEP